MRTKRNNQNEFSFQPPSLKITRQYYERYERISRILDENPEILERVHRDLKKVLKSQGRGGPGRKCEFTSDTVLRIVICQILEGESLRGIVIRIDGDNFLRRFVRIYNGPMIDFTTFCTLERHPAEDLEEDQRASDRRRCRARTDQRREAPDRHDSVRDEHSLAHRLLASLGYVPRPLSARQHRP